MGDSAISSDLGRDSVPESIARRLDGQVAVLTLQFAPHNLLGQRLVEDLLDSLEWAKSVGARAVILRSGLRHFCAGVDLDFFTEAVNRGQVPDIDFVEVLKAFDELPIPILASVHGICVGGGFELALACDLVISADTAKFGSVESTIGMHPIWGGIQRVAQRAGAARAKELGLLGRRYDARTFERWGLINFVVSEEQLEDATLTLAQELAHGPTVAHAATKQVVSLATRSSVGVADDEMRQFHQPMWESQDLKTGLASFAENGPGMAVFEGR